MEIIVTLFCTVALIIFVILYGSFVWGFVMYKFWYWFILPVFPMLPHISFWQAVGLMFFIGLFKNHTSNRSIKEDYLKDDKSSTFVAGLIIPWAILAIAAIVNSVWIS